MTLVHTLITRLTLARYWARVAWRWRTHATQAICRTKNMRGRYTQKSSPISRLDPKLASRCSATRRNVSAGSTYAGGVNIAASQTTTITSRKNFQVTTSNESRNASLRSRKFSQSITSVSPVIAHLIFRFFLESFSIKFTISQI